MILSIKENRTKDMTVGNPLKIIIIIAFTI